MTDRISIELDRLTSAVARLEAAMDAHGHRTGADQTAMQSELRELRSSHAALQAEARTVTSRIDAVIGRLRSVAEA